ncbi:MAG: hypothetical protein ABUL43_02130 [Hyphomicrobium sp.]
MDDEPLIDDSPLIELDPTGELSGAIELTDLSELIGLIAGPIAVVAPVDGDGAAVLEPALEGLRSKLSDALERLVRNV